MSKWRHKKRGTIYTEIGRARFQSQHNGRLADGEALIVYQGEDGQLWVRPKHEFLDGRFERVDDAET